MVNLFDEVCQEPKARASRPVTESHGRPEDIAQTLKVYPKAKAMCCWRSEEDQTWLVLGCDDVWRDQPLGKGRTEVEAWNVAACRIRDEAKPAPKKVEAENPFAALLA